MKFFLLSVSVLLPLTLLITKITYASFLYPFPSLSRCSSVKLRVLSLSLSLSLSRCSSVTLTLLRLLSLSLSFSLSRCSSVQFRLLSIALCRSLSRWAWLACRLLSRFLSLPVSILQTRGHNQLSIVLNWLRWTSKLLLLGFLRFKKSRWPFVFAPRLTDYPKFYIGMPVVRRDGRAGGRAGGVPSRDYFIFWDR